MHPRPMEPGRVARWPATLALLVLAWCVAVSSAPGIGAPVAAAGGLASQAGPLFIDDRFEPTISISWERRDGSRVEFRQTMPWGSKTDLVHLGHNVQAFAAVGGTRIDLQQGHPLGSVVRVGFYKKDAGEPFFADIKPGSIVEVALEGVRFIEPATASRATALHHLQYALEDVLNCGLDGSAIDQYNTATGSDSLGGSVTAENGRPGVLRIIDADAPAPAAQTFRPERQPAEGRVGGPQERFATVRFTQDAQTGAIGMHTTLPYELFRHVRDPWLRAEPGTFFEPTHFHVEFESLPARAILERDAATAGASAGR